MLLAAVLVQSHFCGEDFLESFQREFLQFAERFGTVFLSVLHGTVQTGDQDAKFLQCL